jgi:hypothetical protein
MPPTAIAEWSTERTTLGPLARRAPWALGAAGLVLVGLALGLGLARGDGLAYFLHSYLASFAFWLSLSLGALFLVAILFACRAGWAVSIRRLAEVIAGNLPWLAIWFLPILLPVVLGSHALYEWTDPHAVEHSAALQQKQPYLNVPFFAARAVVYFAIWWFCARYYLRRSTEQDRSADPRLTLSMERFSGPALLLLALTATFASFDWLMSLDPLWYSTIFGVYYFGGAFLGALCFLVLAAIGLQAGGRLTESITTEHYHDLGKLILSFVIFWGYIAFSQYMLIWYGNIPEETRWYLPRQTGPWATVSLALVFGHLLIPFFGLLPRWAKRSKLVLGFWAAWILVFHWIDMLWLVMPEVEHDGLPIRTMDLLIALGLGCLWLAGLVWLACSRSLIASGDPRLAEAVAFENV